MKTVHFGPVVLKIYDSIKELPPHRESLMQYYMLSEFGIGHDFQSIGSHLTGLRMAIHEGNQVVINQEMENLILNYYTMAMQYNPEHIAWMCLIHSIDDEPLTDMSEDNLKAKAQWLSETGGVDYAWKPIFDEVKKKFPMSSTLSSLNLQTEEDWLTPLEDLI